MRLNYNSNFEMPIKPAEKSVVWKFNRAISYNLHHHIDKNTIFLKPVFYCFHPSLYGSNTDDRPPQTHPPPIPPPQPTPAPPPGAPNFCANSRFDTVTRHEIDGRALTYAFQGEYYALITNSGMAPYYPRRISQDWPGGLCIWFYIYITLKRSV